MKTSLREHTTPSTGGVHFKLTPEQKAAFGGAAPLVSILIPVHNRLDLTVPCLDSIHEHATPGVPTEIIIIDDASTDGTAEFLENQKSHIRSFRNAKRQNFGRNMNEAAQQARGKYLCLLNNDTLVTSGWLEKLVEVAEKDPTIGVVGNKQLWPDSNTVNHAGMVFDDHGFPVHLYPGQEPDAPCVNISREFQILTAACWLVPRQFFLEIGGFNEAYQNGFEDVDFCLRARQNGKKVFYCHESVIYHYGQSSPGRQTHDNQNWMTFQKMWAGQVRADVHDFLRQDAYLPTTTTIPEPVPFVKRRRPQTDAQMHLAIDLEANTSFTWVVAQLALAMESIGSPVSIKPGTLASSITGEDRARLQKMMSRNPSQRAHVKYTHFWHTYLQETLAGDINAEFFCTNYRYGNRSKHELDRWMRHVVMNGNRKLAASQFCLDALTELGVPEEQCAVVPYAFSPEVLTTTKRDTRFQEYGRVLLALVNSHDVYRLGTDLLLEAYARAFKKSDDVVLVLKDYGMGADCSIIQEKIAELEGGPRIIHFQEFSSKEELIALYRGADCFVAPFRGEGFGMKIIDAFAAGLPVVAPNYGGPADFQLPGSYYSVDYKTVPVCENSLDRMQGFVPHYAEWCECDIDDLAAKMRDAVENKEEALQRAERGRKHVVENFSWKNSAEKLRDAIDRFSAEREKTIQSRRISVKETTRRISVLIPCYNQAKPKGNSGDWVHVQAGNDALLKTLDGYRKQTLPKDAFEIVIVDDGSPDPVADFIAQHGEGLNIRVLGDGINRRAGGARNLGLPQTRGEIVLITGDDIIPEPHLLAEHLVAHAAHPQEETAVLGRIDWHKDLKITELMRYITEEGGQQFAFDHITPGSFVHEGFFYTSNVSVKRSLLMGMENHFSRQFTGYGHDDIEFAVRLARQQGMRLLYHPPARGFHDHPMTDEQVLKRQYNVGRSLTTYALVHPDRIPREHMQFLEWLEMFQVYIDRHPEFARYTEEMREASEGLEQWLLGSVKALSFFGKAPTQDFTNYSTREFLGHGQAWSKQEIGRIYNYLFELNERSGMADEWVNAKPNEPNPARDYLRMLLTSQVWRLTDKPGMPVPVPVPPPVGRVRRLARRVRHNRLLAPMWTRLARWRRLSNYKQRVVQMLDRLP